MPPIRIRPEYVLILKFDIKPGMHEPYFRYVVGDFVPAMQEMNLYLHRAWHVVYGDYPERHLEFITEKRTHLQQMFKDERWEKLEERLHSYTDNYSLKVVRFRGAFRI